jgi:hypothetical protein
VTFGVPILTIRVRVLNSWLLPQSAFAQSHGRLFRAVQQPLGATSLHSRDASLLLHALALAFTFSFGFFFIVIFVAISAMATTITEQQH